MPASTLVHRGDETIADGGTGWEFGSGHFSPFRSSPSAPASAVAAVRRRPRQASVFDNRRGLLLSAEQLAGPPAPTYLLRRAYVYGRQNLL